MRSPTDVRGLACLLLLARIAAAQGGPPLLTDDPGTPGDGRFEINFAATFERAGDTHTFEAPLLDFNYGLGERVQLKYEVPWVYVDEPGASAHDGLGNSLVGVKWRFRDVSGRSPALSTYPQVEFENPGSSSSERGIVDEGTTLFLPFEAAWDLGEIGLGVEVGRAFRDEGDDEWIGGIAVSRSVTEEIELLAEVHADASADLDASSGILNFGSRVELAPGRVLLASVGSGLWSARSERTDLVAYVGIQFLF